MSLFSRRPRNRKRRRAFRRRDPEDWKREILETVQQADEQEEHEVLHARIGHLQQVIARQVAEEEKRLYMRSNNILPPPEPPQRPSAQRSMSSAQRRRYLAERNRCGLRFFGLFLVACGLAWWLLESGV